MRVLIVGSGNAALCAALAAAERGAEVTVLESAPEKEFGGNSRYTAGALRFAYESREDVLDILNAGGVSDERLEQTDFGTYPARQFLEELTAAAEGEGNPQLQRILVEQSRPTVLWLTQKGVRFEPIYTRQAYRVDGRYVFWGGLTLAAEGEGEGLVQAERRIARLLKVQFCYDTEVTELIRRDDKVVGVVCKQNGNRTGYAADRVILACGGFEANARMRKEYLGEGWDQAKVRGTEHNLGQGIEMALALGAKTAGNWGGCHAVFMDTASPEYGNLSIPHRQRKNYRKISYPFGVILNANGERFVDEGADFRNYTYAKYGREVLRQPGRFGWQIFDAQVTDLLYEEYKQEGATQVSAPSLEDLAGLLDGVRSQNALATLRAYNTAVAATPAFNPTVKDGKCTHGLVPPKSNWALKLEKPPFTAYRMTCGITFTYGGLAIDNQCRVLDTAGKPIAGLFAAGELVGDIFYHNYPGGSGLTAGAVFGRLAGEAAVQ